MKKLWKRDRKYYFFVVILIMIMSVFAAEKVHTILSKHVLWYYVHEEGYGDKVKEYFAKKVIEESKTLKKSNYYWFLAAVEENYERKYWEYRNEMELYESPNQGREVFRGKLIEAYRQSIKQAEVNNVDELTYKEQASVKRIFEIKINQVYEEVTDKSIEQDCQNIMISFSNEWEGDEYSRLVELLNGSPNAYENMINQLYDVAFFYERNAFGYEDELDQFNFEIYAIMLFMVFIFIVQIIKWKFYENHEFELTLPICKKTKTIYELLTGMILVSIPCVYFMVKGVVWQIYYSELDYYGAMNQYLFWYTLESAIIIWIICLILYFVFYLFRQMSHSIIFAGALYILVGFPVILYNLYYANYSVTVIGGLFTSVLLFALNVWIGIRDEGSNTKLFKYKSFQLIVNLILIGLLFYGLVYYGVFIMAGELLFSAVVFMLLLALIALINLWIYRYDYKRAR